MEHVFQFYDKIRLDFNLGTILVERNIEHEIIDQKLNAYSTTIEFPITVNIKPGSKLTLNKLSLLRTKLNQNDITFTSEAYLLPLDFDYSHNFCVI